MVHVLKILPQYFKDIESGIKTFEIRKKDRPYKVDDCLYLLEYNLETKTKTGKGSIVIVTYILDNEDYCKSGYVVLGIRKLLGEEIIERKDEIIKSLDNFL